MTEATPAPLKESRFRLLWRDAGGALHQTNDPERLPEILALPDAMLWADVFEPDAALLVQIADRLDIHPLAVEDCLLHGQFPKFDDYGSHLAVVLHEPILPEDETGSGLVSATAVGESRWKSREVEVFWGRHWVLTHHALRVPIVDAVWKRALAEPSRLLGRGPAGVLWLLADKLAEQFRPVLDVLEDRLTELEAEVLRRPTRRHQVLMGRTKRELLALRRAAAPQRDLMARLSRDPHPFLPPELRPYFADVHDRMAQVMEETEMARDLLAGLRDMYLAGLSNRTNDTVKLLTVFATALLPVNVLAGIYGMNFEHIPLANRDWGFFAMLALMASISSLAAWLFLRIDRR